VSEGIKTKNFFLYPSLTHKLPSTKFSPLSDSQCACLCSNVNALKLSFCHEYILVGVGSWCKKKEKAVILRYFASCLVFYAVKNGK